MSCTVASLASGESAIVMVVGRIRDLRRRRRHQYRDPHLRGQSSDSGRARVRHHTGGPASRSGRDQDRELGQSERRQSADLHPHHHQQRTVRCRERGRHRCPPGRHRDGNRHRRSRPDLYRGGHCGMPDRDSGRRCATHRPGNQIEIPDGFPAGPLDNTTKVAADTEDPDPANNTSTAGVNVQVVAETSIVKEVINSSVVAGTDISYRLTARNIGPATAPATTISDTLPTGTTFVSATAAGGCPGQPAGRRHRRLLRCGWGRARCIGRGPIDHPSRSGASGVLANDASRIGDRVHSIPGPPTTSPACSRTSPLRCRRA